MLTAKLKEQVDKKIASANKKSPAVGSKAPTGRAKCCECQTTITRGADRATRELINATAWWDHVTEWHNPCGHATFIGISAKHYHADCSPVAIKAAKVVKAKKVGVKRKR